MPGPPPPPPMAPAAPPPPMFSPPKGGPDDRGALLKSIRQGAKLKKTVTVDKSAPAIPGKVSSNLNSNSVSSTTGSSNSSVSNSASTPNGMPLGGLFAGGMPKLRSTGKIGASTLSNSTSNIVSNGSNNQNNRMTSSNSNSKPITPVKNFNSIQNELKKQLASPSDNRNRGPPPPAPVRNVAEEPFTHRHHLSLRENNTNGLHLSQNSLNIINSSPSLQANSSTLHRKAKSNANLSMLDSPDCVNSSSGFQLNKPVINHGKPNLAPKPPSLNGKPKNLVINGKISRAHSMRSPRSPSPQSPDTNKFGTVRHLSSVVGQTLAFGAQSPRPRPPLNGRPSVPPPSVPPQQQAPPPPKQNSVKPPNHAPPPPPGCLPQPPSHAPPPPPPHKTQPMRPPPAIPGVTISTPSNNAPNISLTNSNNSANFVPPPPPPRHSSMRESSAPQLHRQRSRHSIDFDEKFKSLFQSPDRFPRPPIYRNVLKLYSNKQDLYPPSLEFKMMGFQERNVEQKN